MAKSVIDLAQKGIRNPQKIPPYVISKFHPIVTSSQYMLKHRKDFKNIQRYCMFIGHGRTGHSLVGSLLNAHPQMVVSHELHALSYINEPFLLTQEQLFALIFHRDDEFSNQGREWTKYKYDITGAWQGEIEELRVIGDKKGGASSSILRSNPELLQNLREMLDVHIRVIHVVRNPFDSLASRRTVQGSWKQETIDRYFRRADTVEDIHGQLSGDEFYRMTHEEFVADTTGILSELCDFLGVSSPQKYLKSCEDFVFDSPKQTRYEVDWPEKTLTQIKAKKDDYSWLEGYSFDD